MSSAVVAQLAAAAFSVVGAAGSTGAAGAAGAANSAVGRNAVSLEARRQLLSNSGDYGWTYHNISTEAPGAESVFAIDLDGDGDLDVTSAERGNNADLIMWYENVDGSAGSWTSHVIARHLDGVSAVYAIDVDGDGDIDVLSASKGDDTIAWYENNDSSGTSWPKHVITSSAVKAIEVFAIDVDGDGDVDVLSASRNDNTIAWYENNDSNGTSWTTRVIMVDSTMGTDAGGEAASLFAIDMDGDGDIDVASGWRGSDSIFWHENVDGNGTVWDNDEIYAAADNVQSVFAIDVNGDGRIDVLSASCDDHTLAWYENVQDGSDLDWIYHEISTARECARDVFATDIDNDGDTDVVLGSRNNNTIAWHENLDGIGESWMEHVIYSKAEEVVSVFSIDLDGDGNVDVLSASSSDGTIAW